MQWSYRLNPALILKRLPDGALFVSLSPPAVWRLSPAALRLLEWCDGKRTATEIARMLPGASPERVQAVLEGLADRHVLVRELPADHSDWDGAAAVLPSVSVIVPVRNRPDDLEKCLTSLRTVRYPRDRLEIVVVDDASTDRTPEVARAAGVKLLTMPKPVGQSACRNVGARAARGEILAFTDSDCVVSERWLLDLVRVFEDPAVVVVGGLVTGRPGRSVLDRYEHVFSSLYMGRRVAELGPGRPVGYVPACNLLVRRTDFLAVGGFREDLRVGEDVDLCWRLLTNGRRGWYLPCGTVEHRHRTQVWPFLRRRAEYATSESWLEAHHPAARKYLPLLRWPLAYLLLFAFLPLLDPAYLFPGAALAFLLHFLYRFRALGHLGIPSPALALRAQVQDHLAFWGTLSAMVSRYYLLPLLVAGVFWTHFLWFGGLALVVSSLMEYRVRQPQLDPVRTVAARLAELVAYQVGVYYGCIRNRNFTPLLPRLLRRDERPRPKTHSRQQGDRQPPQPAGLRGCAYVKMFASTRRWSD